MLPSGCPLSARLEEVVQVFKRLPWNGMGTTQIPIIKEPGGCSILLYSFNSLNGMCFLQRIWSWLSKPGNYDSEWLVWTASEIWSITRSWNSQAAIRYDVVRGKWLYCWFLTPSQFQAEQRPSNRNPPVSVILPLQQIADNSEQSHFFLMSPIITWKQQPDSKIKNPLVVMTEQIISCWSLDSQ